ncbi:nuclear transport factor 2 family protein [Cloacibacterium sp. TD35]|uniref:nuclear transport factor 2 family protein n=1 Tax=Cloacibacterium sp. TD35 TaxID=2976818 RepID=UPI00237DB3F8|nr:nuclear transport factor 2 family protein [Cloacibacterium sp. TD35]WDT67812.1 nuclear transport factor 2 family protein [Cloacibacterium sp. TD35]
MKKIFFLLISSFSFAQNTSEKEIIKPIENLFQAMKSADSLGVKNAFSNSAIMQTFGKNQEIRTDKLEDFAKQVGASKAGDLDERFTISKILVDGNMASVWVPYQFYYKGNFSHCGVNSFQLAKINNEWKIQYIIDTRRKDNCTK